MSSTHSDLRGIKLRDPISDGGEVVGIHTLRNLAPAAQHHRESPPVVISVLAPVHSTATLLVGLLRMT